MKRINLNLIIAIFLLEISAISGVFGQKDSKSNLVFDLNKYVLQTLTMDGKTFKVRAFENIIYVANPVDTTYQNMNIYIPEEYFEGGSINGYTAITAPIFFPNRIGGYIPALAATALPPKHGDFPEGMPQSGFKPPDGNKITGNIPGGMPPMGVAPGGIGGKQQSAILVALSKGYIVASAGARGRTNSDKNGTFTGKAPAVIVDLKAAVRYLKFNDRIMPGNANKIISNGTSAGGALSVLLGATGNNPDYEPYLKALGAADATDNIFAVSAYCPITNLENADKAYEWQFDGIYTYKERGFPQGNNQGSEAPDISLTVEQINVSKQLKKLFPDYLNSLNLIDKNGVLLTLDANGNGDFKALVKSYVIASAQKALNEGSDLSGLKWLKIDNKIVTDMDFDAYVKYMERMKTPPAFDALDLSSPENQLFGNAKIDKQHFTDYSSKNSLVAATTADNLEIKMMNPMNYIGQPQTNTAKYWRIRHGTKDKDTGLAIPIILGTYLQNKGFDVNLALPWDIPHSGDYDLNELFDWADSICR